jgi:hypothetical protein
MKQDRTLVVIDTTKITLNELYKLYEDGKHRRYTLLFSVNGGAFAIVSFLLKGDSEQVGLPMLLWIGLVMSLFSAVMWLDIYEFGKKMRELGGALDLFGDKGKLVLAAIALSLVAVWLAAAVVGLGCIKIPTIAA